MRKAPQRQSTADNEFDIRRQMLEYRGLRPRHADVAELADALVSGTSEVTLVKVQVLSSAP